MAHTRRALLPFCLIVVAGLAAGYLNGRARQVQGNEALNAAVGRNDLAAAERALRQGADPNVMPSQAQRMWNSLEWRMFVDPRAWPVLLEFRRTQRFRAYPSLFFAKSPAMVKLLVSYGADPNGTGGPGHRTPLMQAASGHGADPAKVRALLDAGAAVNQRDRSGRTALHGVTGCLQYEVRPGGEGRYGQILRILLNHGADVNARCPDGSTALALAERSPHTKIVHLLKAAGATR